MSEPPPPGVTITKPVTASSSSSTQPGPPGVAPAVQVVAPPPHGPRPVTSSQQPPRLLHQPPGITSQQHAPVVNPANVANISGIAPGLVRYNPGVIVPPMAKAPAPEFDPNQMRGRAAGTPMQPPSKKSKIAAGKRKWARKQVIEKSSRKLQLAEGSDNYNIWYHKYYGDDDHIREKATTRCRPKLDTGMTLGDVTDNKFICVHFAMGSCIHGADCKFLHRLPRKADEKNVSMLHDVFGRERHQDHRDDMGGTGSFDKNTRTLYVTGMAVMQSPQGEEILARHFGQWGEIEEVSLKPKYGCAFIRYTHRFYAEFGKVAMAEQSLDHNEQINVRWAYDDPNPKAIVREKWMTEQKLKDRLEELGHSAKSENISYETPTGYNPVFKEGVTTYGKGAELYPSTDHQYSRGSSSAMMTTGGGATTLDDYYAQNADYYKTYYANYYYGSGGNNSAQHGSAGTGNSSSSSITKVGVKRKMETAAAATTTAGPMTADEIANERERKRADFQRNRQAKMATAYVKQQVSAMHSLDSVLNTIDKNFSCYNDENDQQGQKNDGEGQKPANRAQYDAFMASINSLTPKK